MQTQMTEKRILKIPEIPQGSRLEGYVKAIDEIVKTNSSKLDDFFLDVFKECSSYARNSSLEDAVWPLTTIFHRCATTKEFQEIFRNLDNEAIEKETPKYPEKLLAVHFGDKILAKIFVDCERLVGTLKHNAVTFVYTMVETYFHEILHSVLQERKSEQEVWDMQFPLIEDFLGFKIPEERKKMSAGDYYSSKT